MSLSWPIDTSLTASTCPATRRQNPEQTIWNYISDCLNCYYKYYFLKLLQLNNYSRLFLTVLQSWHLNTTLDVLHPLVAFSYFIKLSRLTACSLLVFKILMLFLICILSQNCFRLSQWFTLVKFCIFPVQEMKNIWMCLI